MNLDRFLKLRRKIEVGFWVVLLSLITFSETMVQKMDANRHGMDVRFWEIASWEATSAVALFMLLPLVIYFDSRFTVRWPNLKITVPAHVGFSMVFSILHVSMMVTMRKGIYYLNGSTYDFGVIHEQFFYEYLKDIRSYAIILALIYLYRFLVLRLQGEASLLGVADSSVENRGAEQKPERFLVKKLGREFLIKVSDIEHIEAAGNYVNMRISNRVYPLREALKNIEQRLEGDTFKRIHRSHIINLNHVAEIKPLENGDAQVLLKNGEIIPMSRSYRSQFFDRSW